MVDTPPTDVIHKQMPQKTKTTRNSCNNRCENVQPRTMGYEEPLPRNVNITAKKTRWTDSFNACGSWSDELAGPDCETRT